jgi:hypothetical protein
MACDAMQCIRCKIIFLEGFLYARQFDMQPISTSMLAKCYSYKKWVSQCAKMIRSWCAMQEKEVVSQLEEVAKSWEAKGSSPLRLPGPLTSRHHFLF